MDRSLQDLLRQARANPTDADAWRRCAVALRRAGQPLPADVDDAQRYPPGPVPLEQTYKAYGYEDLEQTHHHRDWTADAELPAPHRIWWVRPQALGDAELAELSAHGVPGLSFLRDRKVGDKVAGLARLPHLSYLSLASSGADDALLEALPQLPSLTELDLAGCKLTEQGLATLAQRTPNLTRLTLDNTKKIQDYGALADLPHLRRLSVRRGRMGLKLLKTLPTLPLTHLALYGCPCTPKQIGLLTERLPELRELSIPAKWEAGFTAAHLTALAEFQTLHTLCLIEAMVEATSLAPLTKLQTLRRLDLSPSQAATDLSALAQLPLDYLYLGGQPHAGALDVVAQIASLRALFLHGDADGPTLARLPALEWLCVAPMDDELVALVQQLGASATLKHLHLQRAVGFPHQVEPPALPGVTITKGALPRPETEPPEGGAPWTIDPLAER